MQKLDITSVPVAIIDGGLSGLYAAYLLEQKGIDYILLEARDSLGGRILASNLLKDSALEQPISQHRGSDNVQEVDSFDLGPSWFWPDYQPQLGDMMVERAPNEPAVRMQGYKSSPPSMRIAGGMAALIDALYRRLDSSRVFTGQIVRRLHKADEHIEITSEDTSGQFTTWRAQHILLALPPRLVEDSITFEPALPSDMITQWRNTATWMASHAKYFAVYDTAFWRELGLSGAARSSQGPMVEIHDASSMGGNGALFGFIGVPALVRQSVCDEVLKAHCRAQLVRLFGEQADTPKAEYLKDWSQDKFTATTADASSDGQHAVAPVSKAISGVWSDCLTGIGSEWSPQFSGYIAGAIEAASLAVQSLPEKT